MTPESTTGRRPDASMSLLTDLLNHPLEPGYAQAAKRRAPTGAPPTGTIRGRCALAFLMVSVGFVVALSVLGLRQPSGELNSTRSDLVRRIETRRIDLEATSTLLNQLRIEVAQARSARLQGPGESQLSQRLSELELAAGAVAVRGPGVSITVDDSPTSADPRQPADSPRTGSGQSADGAVLARDLQQVANALWLAGAEGIDINGQRLTATAAIRMAGRAVIVGYRPLTRPYVINAVGPPTLADTFARGYGGQYLASLRSGYAIPSEVNARDQVTVAAAPALSPRYASVVPAAGPASGATTTPALGFTALPSHGSNSLVPAPAGRSAS